MMFGKDTVEDVLDFRSQGSVEHNMSSAWAGSHLVIG